MTLSRRRLDVRGAVQGVGFRPFVHRLAADLQLAGWVANTPMGVAIEIEGPPRALEAFRRRLEDDRPPLARIAGLESLELDPASHVGFEIRNSLEGGPP
ncbi:MAG TPA: acylphosphatase, partial [Planctomycetota bacterium]|nr:acylphosphatase [Planctomycetota bacterium]